MKTITEGLKESRLSKEITPASLQPTLEAGALTACFPRLSTLILSPLVFLPRMGTLKSGGIKRSFRKQLISGWYADDAKRSGLAILEFFSQTKFNVNVQAGFFSK